MFPEVVLRYSEQHTGQSHHVDKFKVSDNNMCYVLLKSKVKIDQSFFFFFKLLDKLLVKSNVCCPVG